jgi:hypothetical protein
MISNLIEEIAKLKELEAEATPTDWAQGHVEFGCIAANGGRGNVIIRRTNGGSIPLQNDTDLICGLRNAAPKLLDALDFRAGDARILSEVLSFIESEATESDWEDAIEVLHRYRGMAAAMEGTK